MEETTTTKKGGMNPLMIAVIVIVLIAGAGFLLTKSKKNMSAPAASTQTSPTMAMKMNETTTSPSPSPEAMTGSGSATTSDTGTQAVSVDMEAGSFYYKPNTLTVKKGQKVKINFHSVSMMHNFNIDELNVHSDTVKKGDTGTIEFTPDKTGTFEYYCSVGKHRSLGQVGKITVE